MTLRNAIARLENDLFPQLEASEMGRGILEGALNANENPINRELVVEMTALYIVISEEYPDYFHYKIANWLPRAASQMNWDDSLDWWASVMAYGFISKYRDRHPMPEDLEAAIVAARDLINR